MSDLRRWSICLMKIPEMDTSHVLMWPNSEPRTSLVLGRLQDNISTFQKTVLESPFCGILQCKDSTWTCSREVSYFSFSEILLLQNLGAQIWFLDSLEYCVHSLFHTCLALIQKGFDACRNISHLEDKVSNWRSGNLQHLRGMGDDTFGLVVPIAAAKSAHCRPHLSMQST